MCGIVGVASICPITDRDWLTSGRDALIHRGPDDYGEWWSADHRVGMAHRRLSIVDLSADGKQPMHHDECGLTVVFNGEIYNHQELRADLRKLGHKFRTKSDTEVLLAAYVAWGANCLERLNGMFAFAIYDAAKRKLFLARDRAGEKPMFLRQEKGTIYFASELKGLLANRNFTPLIDSEALDCYLAMGYVPGDRCILKGFSKLPPAHALIFDLDGGAVSVWRYWLIPEPADEKIAMHEDDLEIELENLLEDAVGRQLIADVPVGVLLSGGVDSSLITAMAVRRCTKIRTFSIGFPGHGANDELPHARLIARHFRTEHIELSAHPTSADLIPRLARQFDEPMADSSMIPTWLVANLVRQHCKVALGGDGGDELFAGYSMHQRLMWLYRHVAPLPPAIRTAAAFIASQVLPIHTRGRNHLVNLGNDYDTQVPHFQELFGPELRRKLLPKSTVPDCFAERVRESRFPVTHDLLQRATRFDFENYLAEDILVKVDRASMLNSLEVRAPFLDYRLVEFAFSKVPSSLKATHTDKKILLKRITKRLLPEGFDRKRKQGFSLPLADWLRAGPFRDLFWDTLLAQDSLFDGRTVRKLLQVQERNGRNAERLFAIVQFELWRRCYGATLA